MHLKQSPMHLHILTKFDFFWDFERKITCCLTSLLLMTDLEKRGKLFFAVLQRYQVEVNQNWKRDGSDNAYLSWEWRLSTMLIPEDKLSWNRNYYDTKPFPVLWKFLNLTGNLIEIVFVENCWEMAGILLYRNVWEITATKNENHFYNWSPSLSAEGFLIWSIISRLHSQLDRI